MTETPPPPPPSGEQPESKKEAKARAKAEKAYEKANRPWYKKKRFIIPGAVVLVAILASALGGGDAEEKPTAGATESSAPAVVSASPTPTPSDTSEAPTTATPSETSEPAPTTPEATQTSTPAPTASSTPPPTEPAAGFGDGTYTIGEDLDPGTYRSSDASLCYWARLSGFSGELDDIITNGNNASIVTVADGDAGFETNGCGTWVPVEDTAPAAPAAEFGDGTYQVGVHIEPGTYSADGGNDLCYWARMSDFSAELDGIITNGNNPTTIEISAEDAGFQTQGCGAWTAR